MCRAAPAEVMSVKEGVKPHLFLHSMEEIRYQKQPLTEVFISLFYSIKEMEMSFRCFHSQMATIIYQYMNMCFVKKRMLCA